MARWLERLSDFDFEAQHHSGRLHNNADGLSHFTWDEQGAKLHEVESEVAWIQSVNVEPLSKESIHAAQSRDPVLTRVVMWLKAGVRPPRSEAEGGGRKLLSYWSQWGRLLLRDGLVYRRWEHEQTG